MDNFIELMSRKEELHPDLIPWISNTTSLGVSLKHPLVFQIFYDPNLNALCNEQYKHKKEYIEKALKEKDWNGFIWMYERPYRLEKFVEIENQLSDTEYWELLGSIWSDSENLWQYNHLLKWLINSPRSERKSIMNEEEREFLKKLPDEFTIYRGHQRRNRLGYSWTLSYFKAKWFANRFQQKNQGIVKATIKKENVVACLLGRNEYEIIASPKMVNIKPNRKITHNPLKDEFIKNFKLNKNSYHGVWHWEKVEDNALTLAKLTSGADKKVAQLFALIHDTKRENEDVDPNHGHRSAKYAKQLFEEGKLNINEAQLKILMEACKYHNDGETTNDPTIGVCWDADRLDLLRVGVIPDSNYLSTKAGKESIWKV